MYVRCLRAHKWRRLGRRKWTMWLGQNVFGLGDLLVESMLERQRRAIDRRCLPCNWLKG